MGIYGGKIQELFLFHLLMIRVLIAQSCTQHLMIPFLYCLTFLLSSWSLLLHQETDLFAVCFKCKRKHLISFLTAVPPLPLISPVMVIILLPCQMSCRALSPGSPSPVHGIPPLPSHMGLSVCRVLPVMSSPHPCISPLPYSKLGVL